MRIEGQIKDLMYLIANRIYVSKKDEKTIIENFHKLYYNLQRFGKTWGNTTFLGVETLKCPLDLWLYQEIVYRKKPDLIVETGTWAGGSALYLATVCDAVGKGEIISIDIEKKTCPKHKRITYLNGSSTDAKIIDRVRKRMKKGYKVMVILDSDHHKEHVLNELRIYSSIVTQGNYLIVEDTNMHGHPINTDWEGPMEALEDFMKGNKSFEIDESMHKFLMTQNPNGYLLKTKR